MSAALILCQVFPGLFDSEYYVTVNGSAAYYVNRTNVYVKTEPAPNKPVEGKVRGYVVDVKGDKTLVQLPGEVVVGGLRTWVESKAVYAA